ncbi:prepilin peptidase, partial [Patescibacteria group bacterium]|nr:prepilin peptidase [Patescibacteria group bacterium]
RKEVDKRFSFCDGCGRRLKWYENIPVLSWILQKGKSRCCDSPLPLSYPVVELTTGLLFVISLLVLIPTGSFDYAQDDTLILILMISFVVVTFLVFGLLMDLKYMILPDFGTAILIVCALIMNLLTNSDGILLQVFAVAKAMADRQDDVLVGVGAFGFLLFLHLITKGKGMGMGDVKFAFFMGTFLGFKKVVLAFYIAFILGAVVGVVLLLLKKVKRKTQIAFGPFLIVGVFLSWWWGDCLKFLIFNF